MAWDILIRGGMVIDGSGRPGEAADLAIADGRIARLAPALAGDATRIIDAAGLAVTPGFIDIKTHSDFTLPINPKAESKVRQGVTTEIIGHCGFSVAPVLPGKTQLLADYLSGGAPWLPFREVSFPEYLDTFPAASVNAGMLVGHNTLRLMAMGLEDRPPTEFEFEVMASLLDEGLAAGALGFFVGPLHPSRQFRRARRTDAAVRNGEASQGRVLHPYPRRKRRGAGGGGGGDRHRPGTPYPCRDRPPQMLRDGQLGEAGDRAGDDRPGARGGT